MTASLRLDTETIRRPRRTVEPRSIPRRSSTTSRPAASVPPSPIRSAPGGWRVRADVKAAILARFADRTARDWTAGPLTFRDRALGPAT